MEHGALCDFVEESLSDEGACVNRGAELFLRNEELWSPASEVIGSCKVLSGSDWRRVRHKLAADSGVRFSRVLFEVQGNDDEGGEAPVERQVRDWDWQKKRPSYVL